jgi:hypothetical protein
MSNPAEPPLVDPAPKTKVSPKVVFAAVAAFAAPTVLIVLDYLLGEGKGLFAGWPVIAQIAVLSILTSVATAIAGYVKRDPLREAGARGTARRYADRDQDGTPDLAP